MSQFTALADLPTILVNAGFAVMVADDWLEGQCNGSDHYLWTDPDTGAKSHDLPPFGYMVHHTAGSASTPPPHDTSKANAWIGLERDGRLYQEGGGVPTIYLASAGPARISSGYGYRPSLWDFTFRDTRAPAHATGSDGSTAANRYVFNMETVHRGDGSAIDRGVWDAVVGLGVALHQLFGWDERTLGHTSWTKRKIDPKWQVGLPNDGADCVIDVQNEIARILDGGDPPPIDPPPIDPEEPVTSEMPTLRLGDGFFDGPNPEYRSSVKALQIMLSHHDYFDQNTQDPRCGADGAFEDGTEDALKSFQSDKGLVSDGICGPASWTELRKARV